MAESTNESLHPLVKKMLDSKPPIAKLIGFEVERITRGHAIAVLEAGRNMRIQWVLSMEVFCAMSPMQRWEWRSHPPWNTMNLLRPSISRSISFAPSGMTDFGPRHR